MFYHGTSSNLNLGHKLLPPSETSKLSETGRNKNLNKVFYTKDKKYALQYAKKACQKFGGNPVIYRVIPFKNDIEDFCTTQGCTIFTSKFAFIEKMLDSNKVN